MKYLNEEQQAKFKEYRRILSKHISLIVENPVEINDSIVAIQTWKPYTEYKRNDVRIDPEDGIPYWAMHDHTSVEGQELQPSLTPTIWTHYHGTTPETARPFVQEGHNPYMIGHYCIENEKTYKSLMDNLIYAPSVYPQGWEEI